MPQIDNTTFFPQVFGFFLIVITIFVFFLQFVGVNISSTLKIRNWLIEEYALGSKQTKITSELNKLNFSAWQYKRDYAWINVWTFKIKRLFSSIKN